MCEHREHRWRGVLTNLVTKVKQNFVVNAKNFTEACNKADALAFEIWPEASIELTIHRAPYFDTETATAHGIVLAESPFAMPAV